MMHGRKNIKSTNAIFIVISIMLSHFLDSSEHNQNIGNETTLLTPHEKMEKEGSFLVNKTNLMHYLSSVYIINQPLHVLGIFVAHHQEVYCIYTTTGMYCTF